MLFNDKFWQSFSTGFAEAVTDLISMLMSALVTTFLVPIMEGIAAALGLGAAAG